MTIGERGVGRNKKRRNDQSTPPEVTRALLDMVKFNGTVWEPACGEGRMARVIEEYRYRVSASDIRYTGFGQSGVDFLRDQYGTRSFDNIITNPPFDVAEEFIFRALELARHKVAMFLRLNFLESGHRYETMFNGHTPLSEVLVFSSRVTLLKPIKRENGRKKATKAVSYAWFVWDKKHKGPPIIRWIAPL